MRNHVKLVHPNTSIELDDGKHLECNYCNKMFANKDKLVSHIVRHKDVKKERNPIVYLEDKKDFVVDTGDCTLEEWKDFIARRVTTCPKCNKDFPTPRNMRKHLRRVHILEKKHGCEQCGSMFKSRDALNTHKKIKHMGKKIKRVYNFECYYCDAKYTTKYALSDHISSHTGIPNHVCEVCNKGYSCRASLKIHMIKSHLQYQAGVQVEKYDCDICEKVFFEKKRLNKHKAWAHGDKFHLCKVCGAKIKGSLKQHMITHTGERKYCCHICGKKLRGKLKEHMLTHTGERPFACEVCGGTFKNKWYLTVHMRSHNGIRPYTCEVCGQKFAARSCYTSHLRKHSDPKKKRNDPQPFQCQLCRSSFLSEEGLNEHVRKHFGM